MLSLKSRGFVTIHGTIKNTFQNGTERYLVAFSGPFTPRYGECVGNVAGVNDCDVDVFEYLSKKTFPFSCYGVVIQNAKNNMFELADLDLTEVKK